jgi:hypothetical protein
MGPPTGLLGCVAALTAHEERARHAALRQVGDHALLGVRQVVAVVHPDAGIVRDEGDLVGVAVVDVE